MGSGSRCEPDSSAGCGRRFGAHFQEQRLAAITVCRLDLPGAHAASADGNSLGRVVVPTMDPLQTASARSLNSRWGARRGLCAPDGTLAAESVSRGYHATSARFRAPQQRFTRLSPRDSAGSVCRPYRSQAQQKAQVVETRSGVETESALACAEGAPVGIPRQAAGPNSSRVI